MEIIIRDLSEVVVPEHRHRKVFVEKDLEELANSIATKGLMHAPVVRQDGVTLIAGERRLRAITLLRDKKQAFSYNNIEIPVGQIPLVHLNVENELAAREAELHENIRRVDLTWKEKAEAIDELHSLREAEKEETGETQRKEDTALEVYPPERDPRGIHAKVQDVTRDLLIAKFLDDPEVAKAVNASEAVKIITKKLEQKRRLQLARDYDISKLEDKKHLIIQGDVFEELMKIEDNTFDCIITDPPYGIGVDKFRNQSAEKHSYLDTEEYADSVIQFILERGYELTKKQAHLYMFCDILRFPTLKGYAEKLGWYVWRTPLIWDRGSNTGIAPRPEHGPRRCYEAIMYCIKGDKRVQVNGASDVLRVPHDRSVERGAHKPPDLYLELMNRSCVPGNKVLDPTCGTGPVFLAASEAKLIATGIEIDPTAIAMCYERMEGV